MPYYTWIGVTLVGDMRRGKSVAYSEQDLSHKLLQNGVALLKSRTLFIIPYVWRINALQRSLLFGFVGRLLRVGILLPEALLIAADNTQNPLIYDAIGACVEQIKHGILFSASLEKYTSLCNPITLALLRAGEDSGSNIDAFERISQYYSAQHDFKKKICAVIAMPLLTLVFFITISLIIFVFIVPRFAELFSSLGHNLPWFTRLIVTMSEYIGSLSMVWLMSIASMIVIFLWWYAQHRRLSIENVVIYIPYCTDLVYYHQLSQILYSLSLLVQNGVSLSKALESMYLHATCTAIKKQLRMFYDEVQHGRLLSDALSASEIMLPEAISVIRVGEESNTLGISLEYAAQMYRELLHQRLSRIVFLMQPIMILILGCFITGLILAVYLPIMELSRVV